MTVDTLDRLLAKHEFFQELDREDLAFLAGCGRNVRFRAGEYLFREGAPADRCFVVRDGRVALELDVPGRGPLVIDTADADDVVGVSWLFPPHRWQFDARALLPVRAVALDGVCIRAKCEENPRLGYQLMRQFSRVLQRRMQSARLRLVDLYGHGRAG